MPITEAIAEFAGAMEAARGELAIINAQLSDLQSERLKVVQAPPHLDDIVDFLKRGLSSASADFERQFAAHLGETFTGHDGKAAAAIDNKRSGGNVLLLDERQLSQEERRDRTMRGEKPDLNAAALAYFLRDRIAGEIPALVEKLLPEARDGMTKEDREARLKHLDEKIEELTREQTVLQSALNQARQAVNR